MSTLIRALRVVGLSALMLSCEVRPLMAQADPAKAMHERATALRNERKYPEAMQVAKEALALRKRSLAPGDFAIGSSHFLIGDLHARSGNNAEAETSFKAAAAIYAALANGPSALAITQVSLAYTYMRQARWVEAEPLLNKALATHRKTLPDTDAKVIAALRGLANVFENTKRMKEAEQHFKRVLQLQEQSLPPNHPDIGRGVLEIGKFIARAERHADALPWLERAVRIYDGTAAVEQLDLGISLQLLGWSQARANRAAEAETSYRRGLLIFFKLQGPQGADVHPILEDLTSIYKKLGNSAGMELIYKELLKLSEATWGAGHVYIAVVLRMSGDYYLSVGSLEQADSALKRSLAIAEKSAAISATELAQIVRSNGHLASARRDPKARETYLKRTLDILQKAHGPASPLLLQDIRSLISFYEDEKRIEEASPLRDMMLAIAKAKAEASPNDAKALQDLGSAYARVRRYEEAESAQKKALAIWENSRPPNYVGIQQTTSILSGYYDILGRPADQEQMLVKRIQAIEKVHGATTREYASALHEISFLYSSQKRHDDAEVYMQRYVSILEGLVGPQDLSFAGALEALGIVVASNGKHDESAKLYQRAIAIREKAKDPLFSYKVILHHGNSEPLLKKALAAEENSVLRSWYTWAAENLARLSADKRDWERSMAYARLAANERIKELDLIAGNWRKEERLSNRSSFKLLLDASFEVSKSKPAVRQEAFLTGQRLLQTGASVALAQMGTRFAAGTAPIASLLREHQDLDAARRQALAIASLRQVRDWSPEAEKQAAAAVLTLNTIQPKIELLAQQVREQFPAYAALTKPVPLGIEDVQKLLRPNEVLVTFAETNALYVWAISKDSVNWVRVGKTANAIAEMAAKLRCGLDLEGQWTWSKEKGKWKGKWDHCIALKPDGLGADENPPFQTAVAHELYRTLFADIADQIQGKSLLIVPSERLSDLPFHALISEKPGAEALRDVAWLVRRHAITILPSVDSLRLLRGLAKKSLASKPYLAFANPLLVGPDGTDRRAWARQICTTAAPVANRQARSSAGATAKFFRNGLANVDEIRRQSPLPETTDEVCAVAQMLNASPTDIHLGGKATERLIKSLHVSGSLKNYRILHFATHGLLAGESAAVAEAKAEPALLLTPPDTASLQDDGLLTASEIAQLELNAEWVILSACNTAAGNAESTEALSGLARAFFYAGARSLLVSHWYVESASAVTLITKAFSALRDNPNLGRAEALRLGMLALMSEGDGTYAHPAYWAPFMVVGEGAL